MILHDAFEKGLRGVWCATATTTGVARRHTAGLDLGAIGGLTCYFMPELTRDALFRHCKRRHYGTTGAPSSTCGTLISCSFREDPQFAHNTKFHVREAYADVIRPGSVPIRLWMR